MNKRCKDCFMQEGGRCYNEKREGFAKVKYPDRIGSYSILWADGDCGGSPLTKTRAMEIICKCIDNINKGE